MERSYLIIVLFLSHQESQKSSPDLSSYTFTIHLLINQKESYSGPDISLKLFLLTHQGHLIAK